MYVTLKKNPISVAVSEARRQAEICTCVRELPRFHIPSESQNEDAPFEFLFNNRGEEAAVIFFFFFSEYFFLPSLCVPGNATYCSASCFSLREEEIFWELSCAVRGEQDAPELEGCPWQAAAGCCALFLMSGGCLGLGAVVAESFQMLELLWALNPHSNKAKH